MIEGKEMAEATVSDDTYFRDYSVHEYLIDHDKRRIVDTDYELDVYRSNEFFLA